jgi:hypothetical protein
MFLPRSTVRRIHARSSTVIALYTGAFPVSASSEMQRLHPPPSRPSHRNRSDSRRQVVRAVAASVVAREPLSWWCREVGARASDRVRSFAQPSRCSPAPADTARPSLDRVGGGETQVPPTGRICGRRDPITAFQTHETTGASSHQ